MIKQLIILFVLLFTCASLPFSFVSARSKNPSTTESTESWGNLDVLFPESEQALSCDDWDPSACGNGDQVDRERCEGWVNGSKVTCGPRDILESKILGDQKAFEGVLGGFLGGQTVVRQGVSTTSNNTHNPCLAVTLSEIESRAMAYSPAVSYNIFGDINRDGTETAQDISPECQAYLNELNGAYQGNACGSYGTNIGNMPYDFGFVQTHSANRPVVVLVDINEKNRLPDSYYLAKPLILRVTGLSANSGLDLREAGANLARIANPDSIIVFGNEYNNPEAEMYCSGMVSGIDDSDGLQRCGSRYAIEFASFYDGVKSVANIAVAASPLDLINPEYQAEEFMAGALSAYTQADVIAANVYCDASGDVDACITGSDYGLGFYPDKSRKVILEFGPLINYSSTLGPAQVQEQVKFIEDQCGVPNAHAELVTPLIENCANQSSQWLLYDNGVYKTNGEIDDLACGDSAYEGDIGPYYNPETHDPIQEFWRGNYKVKLYDPATQVWEKLQQCAQHIIPGGEGRPEYVASELYCSNPSPVYKLGPSNFQVCQELMQKMIGDSSPDNFSEVKAKLPTDYMRIWQEQFSATERRQVLAISDNKAAVKAYMVVYRDQEYQEPCDSATCRIANVNRRLAQLFNRGTPPLIVLEFRIEGVRKAMEAQSEYSNLLQFPPDQVATRGQAYGADANYSPVCPENFVISAADCEEFALKCDAYATGMGDFCRSLIFKLADEGKTCSEGVSDNTQFVGSKAMARQKNEGPWWWQAIVGNIANRFDFTNTAQPPTEPQPTVQTWVIADQTTGALDAFRNAFDMQFTFPSDEGTKVFRTSGPGDSSEIGSSIEKDISANSDTATLVEPVTCSDGTPGCTRTISASIEGRSDEPPLINFLGGQMANSLQRLTRTYLLPLGDGWSRFMGYDSGLTYLDEMACLYPSIVRAIGIPAEVDLKCMDSEQAQRSRDNQTARGLYTASDQLAADLAALAQEHGISLPYLYAMLHIESPNIFRLSPEDYALGNFDGWWRDAGCSPNGASEAQGKCKALYCYDTCKEWPGGCYNLCVNKANGMKRYSDRTCRGNEYMRPTTVMGMGQLEELTFGGATSLPPEDTSLMKRCEIGSNLDRAARKIQGASGDAGSGFWDETIVKRVARGYCGFDSPGCIEYSEDIYALYQGYAKQLEAQP